MVAQAPRVLAVPQAQQAAPVTPDIQVGQDALVNAAELAIPATPAIQVPPDPLDAQEPLDNVRPRVILVTQVILARRAPLAEEARQDPRASPVIPVVLVPRAQ